jgi:hypothetical protein
MLLAAWWAANHQSPRLAMIAIVVSALLQAIGQYVIAGRVVGWRRMFAGFGLRRADLLRVYGFAGPMMLVTLMAASGSWLVGRIILHGKGAEHAFALYSIGLQWFSLALLLPGMISRVVLPRLVRTIGGAQAYSQQLVRQGALLATGAALGMTVLVVVFGPWLMSIYGTNYDAGRWFIAAYMGAAIFSAPANTLGNSIVARDGQWIWMGTTFVWLLVMLLTATTSVNAGLDSWTGALAQAVGALVLGALSFAICRHKRLI